MAEETTPDQASDAERARYVTENICDEINDAVAVSEVPIYLLAVVMSPETLDAQMYGQSLADRPVKRSHFMTQRGRVRVLLRNDLPRLAFSVDVMASRHDVPPGHFATYREAMAARAVKAES